MKKPELLSPAGNMDALMQALHNGADAIYLGGDQFGARAFADNFSPTALEEAVRYAHLYGKKVYVTVNTLISQDRWDVFANTLAFLNDIGVDAVILQDIGAAKFVSTHFPDLPWHASTQMHNHDMSSVAFAKDLGAERVVLAREMALSKIAAIAKTGIQTEVFIHGALCIAYSGQCLFSTLTQNRSGNQGACAQSCRMRYTLLETKNGTTSVCLTDGEFLLSPKDLGVLSRLDELINAGIDSFKIEGRMKSPQYVGFITALYRRLIDNISDGKSPKISQSESDTLTRLFNRGYTKGLLFDTFGKDMMQSKRPNHRGVVIGQVVKTTQSKIAIKLSAPLNQGDGIKFETTDTGMIAEKIYKNGLLVSEAKTGDIIQLDNKPALKGSDTVLLTLDKRLNERLSDYQRITIPVEFSVVAKVGKPLSITLSDGTHTLSEIGPNVEAAKSTPTDSETIRTQLSRLGDSAFSLNQFKLIADPNVFIPKSTLNQLRRKLTDALTKARMQSPARQKLSPQTQSLFDFSAFNPLADGICVLVRNEAQYSVAKEYPFVRIYTDDMALYNQFTKDHRLFYMRPRAGKPKTPGSMRVLVTENGGLSEMLAHECVADYTLNIQNASSLALLYEKGIGMVTLSPELTDNQIKTMVGAFTAQFGFAPPLEAMVYGRYELMLTQNCIIASALDTKKNCGLCRKAVYTLRDIKGNHYPITIDSACMNHIFAAQNIDRISQMNMLEALGVSSFRISLLDETKDECAALFERFFTLQN
ncbi:MAG: DUF3656 domain-containing protein [Eubacteriales bacterium]